MNKQHFCTVITPDYIDFVKVQNEFFKRLNKNIDFHVLVSAANPMDLQSLSFADLPAHIKCYTVAEVCREGIGKKIYDKYFYTYQDGFRWSMKSVFLNFLFERNIANKIIYIDSDIVFFNDYDFLFDDLENNDILLTPHWFSLSPFEIGDGDSRSSFECNFKFGQFNAGFIGANKNAIGLLEWWAQMCLYSCEKDLEKGFYDDQTHLNLLPFLSANVGIVRHLGCNIGHWNTIECKRVKVKNDVFINGHFSIIFIHFSFVLVANILSGKDYLLHPYFQAYNETYQKIAKQPLPLLRKVSQMEESSSNTNTSRHETSRKFLDSIRHKIRLKTRLKRFIDG